MKQLFKPLPVLGAIAIAAIAFWPFAEHLREARETLPKPSPTFTMAPITRDYLTRNKVIAFYEARLAHDPQDQISLNQLSTQYLQRYRETGDGDDVLRAEHVAKLSLQYQPRYNASAELALASADITVHRFSDALRIVDRMKPFGTTSNSALNARKAGLEMELGHYDAARELLDIIPQPRVENAYVDTVRARYAELTGSLNDARVLLEVAQQQQDSIFDAPAEARAWYHEREGEMAFNAGDDARAVSDERIALELFPTYAPALNALARFSLAMHDYRTAYDAAARGAAVVPLPETLGYQADAALALGKSTEAARLRDEIIAIERIGNALHTSDRLLAVYYAEHGIRRSEAVAIARRDVAVRGEEIFAQDTLAWAQAMNGDWDAARTAMGHALRMHTEDARLEYHAGVIAAHFGEKDAAIAHFTQALALNPHFHPTYADDARKRLLTLRS